MSKVKSSASSIAIEEKKIRSIEEPIGNYLPEYKTSEITIKHLLWMSSGLNWSESGQNPFWKHIRT